MIEWIALAIASVSLLITLCVLVVLIIWWRHRSPNDWQRPTDDWDD